MIVTVVESSQIINRVAFEGNSKLKSDQLAVEVQSKGRAGFTNAAKADADVQRIREAYKKIGHAAAKVTYRLVQLPNGRVDRRLHHRRRPTRPAYARSNSSATRPFRPIACMA